MISLSAKKITCKRKKDGGKIIVGQDAFAIEKPYFKIWIVCNTCMDELSLRRFSREKNVVLSWCHVVHEIAEQKMMLWNLSTIYTWLGDYLLFIPNRDYSSNAIRLIIRIIQKSVSGKLIISGLI